MDSKLIILLILILFGMIAGYMVANGMIDLVSIFSRVTKSQAEENLGGVKLEVLSPVPGVYYQYDKTAGHLDITDEIKITGKNLAGKTLTVSVASPNWYLRADIDGGGEDFTDVKTVQLTIGTDDGDGVYKGTELGIASDGYIYLVRDSDFELPEFVELIFAVGETAKAEVTIVVEPGE